MTISISRNYFWEIFFEDEPTKRLYDPADEFDILWRYPSPFGEGHSRAIELQDGLGLLINDYQLHDRLILKVPEREAPVQYGFFLSGSGEGRDVHTKNYRSGQYYLCGSGTAPNQIGAQSSEHRQLAVSVWIEPERFCSFAGNAEREIDPALIHLIHQPTQKRYISDCRTTSPIMQAIVQQILYCPYWGLTKRMFLEAKVLELLALLIEQEIEVQQGQPVNTFLKPDDIDRLHYAKTLLLQQIAQPPSLTNLARQVGLNECTLKRGFRQVFGKTTFSYLRDYRLEQAHYLLASGAMKVGEVANMIGFSNRSYFAAAFRKKFGLGPKEFQLLCKNPV